MNIDEPLFQPYPSEVYFQNFNPFEVYEVPLVFRNNDKVRLSLVFSLCPRISEGKNSTKIFSLFLFDLLVIVRCHNGVEMSSLTCRSEGPWFDLVLGWNWGQPSLQKKGFLRFS